MNIVHTSDWHAGRIWRGHNRIKELKAVLDHLGDFIETDGTELLLHSGDVFDYRNPSPEAERLVFRFFKRVGQLGVKTVVIAGNHDDPVRLEAWGILSELIDVYTVGKPKPAHKGGLLDITVRGGERAKVAALPFAPAHHHFTALDLAEGELKIRKNYPEAIKAMFTNLCADFGNDTVNLVMAHTHLQGAVLSAGPHSEREVHLGDQWGATPQSLPSNAHYVALGHIHKPQEVTGPSPTHYAGSPLQLDFGEVNEEKTFVKIIAKAGQPAKVETIPYEGALSLYHVECTLEELQEQVDQYQEGWYRIKVTIPERDPDIAIKVKKLIPNAVNVIADWPREEEEQEKERPPDATPEQLYTMYHLREHGQEPSETLLERFAELLEKVEPR